MSLCRRFVTPTFLACVRSPQYSVHIPYVHKYFSWLGYTNITVELQIINHFLRKRGLTKRNSIVNPTVFNTTSRKKYIDTRPSLRGNSSPWNSNIFYIKTLKCNYIKSIECIFLTLTILLYEMHVSDITLKMNLTKSDETRVIHQINKC